MSSSGSDVTTETKDATAAEENAQKAATPDIAATKSEASITKKPEASQTEQNHDNKDAPLFDQNKMGILNDVNIAITIEVGRAQVKIRDLLNLTKGSIIELNKLSGEPVEVYANGKLISLGEIITVNGKYCVRLSSFKDNIQAGVKANGK